MDKITELGFTKYLVHDGKTSYKKEVMNDGLIHIAIITTSEKKNRYTFSVHLKGGNSCLIKTGCSLSLIKRIIKLLF